jgi:hypothetical protein
MRRIGLLLLALSLATPASAQSWGTGTTMRPSRPGSDSPSSRPGSYSNPYVVQDQSGRQLGTVYSARPGGSGSAQPGSYTNPYQYHPNPGPRR